MGCVRFSGLACSAMQWLGELLGVRTPGFQRDEKLEAIAANLAGKGGREHVRIWVDATFSGHRGPALWTWNGIVVPVHLRSTLQPDQLEFVIARLMPRGLRLTRPGTLLALGALLFLVGVAAGITNWTAAVILVVCLAAIPVIQGRAAEREIEADLRAFDLTSNVEAALWTLSLLPTSKWGVVNDPKSVALRRDALIKHWFEAGRA